MPRREIVNPSDPGYIPGWAPRGSIWTRRVITPVDPNIWEDLNKMHLKGIPHCQKFYVGLIIIIVVMALIVCAYKS
jgi:hypothetical protein